MNYCFGVISKNQVDCIINYSNNYNKKVIFIPSRRQVEYNGGYVNNWTTKEFSEYVKNNGTNIKIQRDHGGPGQGLYDDDGYESLKEDCKYFDLIHIDPWKKYSDLNDGIKWTIDMINFCYNINPNIEYEIGTEEAIRSYSSEELEKIIIAIKSELSYEVFNKIKYCVVQCGNSLVNCKNNNNYDEEKLISMLNIVKKYNFISKEHNGDYNNIDIIKSKKILGLEYINIAPEFGTIESSVILNKIRCNEMHYQEIYNMCINSGKWKKWVSSDFDVENNKDQIILITCHYIYSNEEFLKIKNEYNDIDNEIKKSIFNKLLYLDEYYSERQKCCICGNNVLETLLSEDIETPITLSLFDTKHICPQIPYNIVVCTNCETTQIKYLGNISLVYEKNHIDAYGSTKSEKHCQFKNFILENKNIKSICEIGAATGALAHSIVEDSDVDYTIIETDYHGEPNNKIKIVNSFFENADVNDIKADCLVMSDLFEHFYEPRIALDKIKQCNYEYIIFNHPDFDYAIKNKHCIILNIEHTFQIEHQLLFSLLNNYGYVLNRKINYKNFSLFLEFKKQSNLTYLPIKNYDTKMDTISYVNNIQNISKNINSYIDKSETKKFYIWPCSVHTFTLFLFDLNYKKFSGILDNSPNKIGKYIDGYDLLCSSFDNLLQINDKDVTIIISGANEYIKELNLTTECEIKFLEDFM
jgi:hypothetical protein